jgi:hypothetical protein
MPQKRSKRPDYRAEKLLKNVPGNEKEMDRYVDRFFDKYNLWVYLSCYSGSLYDGRLTDTLAGRT